MKHEKKKKNISAVQARYRNRKATITSGKVKTIQMKCFTSTEEMRSGWKARPLQASLANQKVEYNLIAQEVESAEYRRRVSSTYC